MIDLEFVQQLIRSVDESTIDNVEIERGGTRIRVSKTPDHAAPASTPAPAPAPAPAPTAGNASNSPAPVAQEPESGEDQGGPDLLEVTSPMVGTFYRAPTPGADPFTDVGERITKGATLCIIEAMKLMNELEAEVEGTVREVLVENGEPVEYGQVLFRVEPA